MLAADGSSVGEMMKRSAAAYVFLFGSDRRVDGHRVAVGIRLGF
jgi:hypothetical protein